MIDHLKQMAIFKVVVDHGSFRAAANSLRMSPSVVSHNISQLEESLGTALLYRTTRKLALTKDGEILVAAARNMVDAAESGLGKIAAATNQPSGTLNITIPAVLSRSELVDVAAQFIRDYPNVQLSMDFSDVRRDLIGDRLDLAIRMGWLTDSSHKAKKLFEVERKLVASPTYAETKSNVETMDDLIDWDWIGLEPVWNKAETFKRQDGDEITLKPKARISVNDAHALARLASNGAGLAVIPNFLADSDIAAGILIELFPEWKAKPVGVYAVWPQNAPRDGLIKLFVDYLATGLRRR